jgi:hypothetical protein
MIAFTVDPDSFWFGFMAGTSVYVVASGVAYALFCLSKSISSLFRSPRAAQNSNI